MAASIDDTSRKPEHSQEITPMKVTTLLAWTAPGRPFRKRKKEFYITSLLIATLVSIIALLLKEGELILVIGSLVFVSFALASVPPRDSHYKISTEGIMIDDHFFLWQELYDFFFKKRDHMIVLHVRTHAFIPGELTIPLGDIGAEHIKTVLLPYLPFREVVKKSFMEKSGDWLAKTFPLEKLSEETHHTKK